MKRNRCNNWAIIKRYILAVSALLCSLPGYAQIIINNDSLVLDLSKHEFTQEAGSDGLYKVITKVNELTTGTPEYQANFSTMVLPLLPGGDLPPILPPITPPIAPPLPELPATVTVDRTKAVGEIPYQSSVNNGSLSYNVPIDIYGGRNGHQPSLSLSYNSQMGNGVAGYGWSIGGLSSISVTHSNYYYDGNDARPATTDRYSAYSLDGNRLIKTDETTTKIEYQTEFGNIKVTFYAPSGGYYFDVRYPDGKRATFGTSGNTSAQLNYPVTRYTDALGGYIDYAYILMDNVYYVTEVKYGYGSTQHGAVRFSYNSSRSDAGTLYMAGRRVEMNRLLTKIETYYQSSVLLSTYTLTHETSIYSFLSQISLKVNGKEVNPLMFYYGNGSGSGAGYFQTDMAFLSTYFANSNAPDLILRKGKFNSLVGSEGLVAYPNFNSYGVTGHDSKNNCTYGSLYSSTQSLLIYKNLGDYICTPVTIQAGSGFQTLIPADMDGDGNDELVRVNYALSGSNALISLTTYDKNMTARTTSFTEEGSFTEGSWRSPIPRTFLTGDFNGDGKTELMAVGGYKTPRGDTRAQSTTTLYNLESRTKIFTGTPFLYDYFKDALFSMDYNGDGKTDVCLINGSGTHIYSRQESSFVEIASTYGVRNTDISSTGKKELLVQDINGDGITDLLLTPKKDDYTLQASTQLCGVCQGCRGEVIDDPWTDPFNPGGGIGGGPGGGIDQPISRCLNPIITYTKRPNSTHQTWTLLSGTGTGFASSTFEFLSYTDINSSSGAKYLFLLHDINGDRFPDMAMKSGSQVRVYLNNNGTFKTTAESSRVTIDSDSHFIAGAIENMGGYRTSQWLSIKDASVTPIFYTRNEARERMLTGMINSYGVVAKTEYANLTDGSSYGMTANYTSSFPHNKLYADVNVVRNTYSVCNGETLGSQSYYYNDAVIHRQGLGFRGFRKITMRDLNAGTQVEQTFDPTRFGVMTDMLTPTTEVHCSYNVNVAPNKLTSVTLTSKVEIDLLKNNTNMLSYTYDSYGNITREVLYHGTYATVTTANTYVNTNNTTTYKLGFLREQVTSTVRGTSTPWVKTRSISSYNSNFLPLTEIQYVNNQIVSEITRSYTNNLLMQESLEEYDSGNELTTRYEYDTYGRVTKKTDPLGLYETYQYNNKGQLESSTNHKSKATEFKYDDFGRQVKTIHPDGVVDSILVAWASSAGSALRVTTVTATGAPASQTYYDAWGREVRSGKQRFDGSYVYTDKLYDGKSRLHKVSMPFKGTAPTLWNTYAYDTYDRITSLLYASGKEDTYSYSGMNINTEIDGVRKTNYYNVAGELVAIYHYGAGPITYIYRPDGQLEKVTAPEYIVTEFEYDIYGRRIELNDPSLGVTTYQYDEYGNMILETDANDGTTEYEYDAHHRLTKKKVAGQTISYLYYPDNLIKSETNSNGTSKIYEYDDYLRLKTVTENNVDTKSLKKTYTYAGGNISALAYASNAGSIVTENYTYTNGHLKEIKLNNTTSIWKLMSENALGMVTSVTTGGLTRTYSYDAYGNPTGRTVKNGSTVIQNSGYSFNPQTGNLTSRKDNVRNIQESFGYDNLNRLTSFAGKTATYGITGNITSMSHVGTYQYHATKKYALEFVTPYGSTVPTREQEVTYNAQRRPVTIAENGYTATFTYNGDGERVKMVTKQGSTVKSTKHYWGNQYETETGTAGSKEILYLGGDAYSAPAAYVKEGSGAWAVYYLCADYLGSITHVVSSTGTIKQELSYDAWGRLRNPANQTLYAVGSEPALFLGRGYTGHEHLTLFGLVNMNARLYDPVVGRFLSPDPRVQNPGDSQNYNRYSYCLNNPLRYVDPSGEIWWIPVFLAAVFAAGNTVAHAIRGDIHSIGDGLKYFAQGAVTGLALGYAWQFAPLIPWVGSAIQAGMTYYAYAQVRVGVLGMVGGAINAGWNGLERAGKSFLGNFYLDENDWWGGILQGYTRHTWEMPQSLIGHGYTHIRNSFNRVDRVDYFGGVTFATNENTNYNDGVSIGNFININIKKEITNNFDEYVLSNPLYMHEYGHTIDSRRHGFAYLFAVGIPSILSADKAKRIASVNIPAHNTILAAGQCIILNNAPTITTLAPKP